MTTANNTTAKPIGRGWANGVAATNVWAGTVKAAEALAATVKVKIDDAPTFDRHADPEVDMTAALSSDRSMIRQPGRRLFIDYRPNPDALKHLQQIPAEGESLHGIISGKYALWELVPALIERTGQNIGELFIATLSYGKPNAVALLGLVDEGRIGRVSLLVSAYFKAQNRPLYDSLVPDLLKRGHRVLAMRTHCKIILARMADGSAYVVEASANLRSCKNVEQFCLTRDFGLFHFHRAWLDGELIRPRTAEERDE